MIAQWTFGEACLVAPVYTMVGREFSEEVSSLFEASLESLSMGCQIDYVCSFLGSVIFVPHVFHQRWD
jgi:hypothetical protein